MAHTLSWETKNPGLMILLIDQSGSMCSKLGGKNRSQVVVESTLSILEDLVGYCQKGMEIRDKFSCIIIGYSTQAEVVYKKNAPSIDKDFFNEEVIIEAKESGLTNMEDALKIAISEINTWKEQQRIKGLSTPAPRVVNITDGRPEMMGITDDEAMQRAESAARELMAIQTDDGNVILSNIFLYSSNIRFPQQIEEVRNAMLNVKDNWAKKCAEFLFRISSGMTEASVANANSHKLTTKTGCRMLLCSEEPTDILKFMDFASHPPMNDPFPVG